jgi:glycosyltransferase involved in cell wall biosynthesis
MPSISLTVAVVIPVCNRADELKRAINSVLKQNWVADEIVVVENNSDNPQHLLDVVSGFENAKIKFFSLSNCNNANVARNFGADNSSSEYIAYLDSDDEWLPGHLDASMKLLAESGADFVYGGAYVDNGHELIKKTSRQITDAEHPLSFLTGIKGGAAQTSSFVLRRHFFKKVRWDEKLQRHQDYDFFIRAAKMGRPMYNPASDYVIHWARGVSRSYDLESYKYFYKKIDQDSSLGRADRLQYIFSMLKRAIKKQQFGLLFFLFKSLVTVGVWLNRPQCLSRHNSQEKFK